MRLRIDWQALEKADPEVAASLANELVRESRTLRLVASENFATPAALAAQASTAINKVAEGYPGRRYYAGCENIDVIESLARDRAKALFGAEHANVQPHSGSQANFAAYGAFVEPRDPSQKILAMGLSDGGHLTHGAPVSFTGRWFSFVHYGLDPTTEMLDMDQVSKLAHTHKPRLIVTGYSAYPRVIDFAAFRSIADEVGAILLVDASHFSGLVAGGAYPSPLPFADVVTSSCYKTLRGPRGGFILCRSEHASRIDSAVFPGLQGTPEEHTIAAKAVCFRQAGTPEFKEYAGRVVRNARVLAARLDESGIRPVTGGTDSHLVLFDLRALGITGAEAESACQRVGVTANKNVIPFDPEQPAVTSGLRIGTAAVSSLGMGETEMEEVAEILTDVLRFPQSEEGARGNAARVQELMQRFPPYPNSTA